MWLNRARARLLGPLWVAASGGLILRPVSAEDARLALAVPLALGLHGLADLPGGVTGTLGGSLDVLVGARCVDPIACERVLAAEPGGTLDLGLGLPLGRRLALGAEARVGVGLRHEYGETLQRAATASAALRLDLNLWLELRL